MGSTDRVPLIEMREIVKSFPGTMAVNRVNFVCHGGEIKGLVGENGAGKTTLMKVLAGIYLPDSGTIHKKGVARHYRNCFEAGKDGIGIVHQNLSLLQHLTVAENIFLGNWPGRRGIVAWKEIIETSRRILERIGIDLDPNELVGSLPMALRQMVEIAKVLAQDPEIIVFDEPTAPLSKEEVANLFGLFRDLQEQGKGIIFISHRLKEILAISDAITVMKDGQEVISKETSFFNQEELIASMIGREFSEIFPAKVNRPGKSEEIFSFEGTLKRFKKKMAFTLAKGDILGIGGLQGQGQIDLLQSIFGMGHCDGLKIKISGKHVQIRNPIDAIRSGIALIPENRDEEGLFLILSVLENLTATTLMERQRFGFIQKKEEDRVVNEIVKKLSIKIRSLDHVAGSLSGGNLQKLVLGKWMIANPKVLTMLEPTKGVDVGTKQEIYRLIREHAERDVAVIFYTSDMLELIGFCDRVLIMNRGFITAQLVAEDITEENIMKASVSDINLLETGVPS